MRVIMIAFVCLFCQLIGHTQLTTPLFVSSPTLTPDGQTLIYCYDGDLWQAPVSGGVSTRLTAMQGYSANPKVSPDGKWLAFSNSQFGNSDVYIMPLHGGDITRLTFHSANDMVDSWSWDSKTIYFTSNRYSRMSEYKISISGGTPQRVFSDNMFDYTHNAFENPLSGEIYFDDSWESAFFANRIGYKGPFNPDIQSYNPLSKKYTRYTDWEGKDMWATTDKKGEIFFASDEANGQYNLYTFEKGVKTPLTYFSTSLMYPFVSANGNKVVFEKDFQIFVYDVASKNTSLIPLQVYKNSTLGTSQNFNVKGKISSFSVSNDGKKIAFISRGKLFVSDTKGKFIKQLTTLSRETVKEVYWLADNETLLYGQTYKGFENLYTQKAEGNSEEKQITNLSKNCRSFAFNSDKSKAIFLCGADEVRQLDIPNMKTSVLVKDEIWGLENAAPSFSPDDRYVMYTAYRNFEQDIFLYRMADGKISNLTNTGVSESDPVWSPDGKYIYFTSDRTHPSYPRGPENQKLYRMPLQKLFDPFRSDMFDSLFTKSSEAGKKGNDTSKNAMAKKPEIKIDFEDIMSRVEEIGPGFGMQSLVTAIQKNNKTFLYFISNHQEGKPSLWKLTFEPFEDTKTEPVNNIMGYAGIEGSKDQYYVLNNGNINKLDLDRNTTDKVDMNYPFTINLNDEFNQMFYEAWGDLQENYYNESFNGINWQAIRDRYATYLPYLQTRADFRILMNNMMGELNSSHFGFSTSGNDEKTFYKIVTAANGIVFNDKNPYLVDHVIKNGCADLSDQPIQKGDELISVDGIKVSPTQNREYYFMHAEIPDEITLGFKRNEKEYTVKIHPETMNAMSGQLYDEWIDANKKRVDQLSNKQIGYVYMKDMTETSLDKFQKDMVSDDVAGKKALILDLRYNTGGNVHDAVLQMLSQKPYLEWKYRGGKMSPQPDFAPAAKPIILLINEQTLSDGEMTAAGFKALKLGKILGNATYRWIIFTTSNQLVDGSTVRLPSWGCYTLDGKNLEQTGVTPDILIKNTFEDRMQGNDPQIKAAVDEIMKELK
ncbi:MAG: PD40 domain-containing protein [Bacteroidetes bacterium]|nr:PD40 domain-containing protein [Bacteroidota bacterium]